ncbi:MAG: hypothetical protein ACOVQ8_01920 [Elstera sp.]|jgi:hypothetical protein
MSATVTRLLPWPPALFIAWVFLWYLQYKFTGHPGSVHLFNILTIWLGFEGYEAVMRIGTGTAELIASLLILYPRTQAIGGLMSSGIMTGAIFFHVVSPLGIDPYNDGADLFKKACAVWVLGLFIAVLRRDDLIALWTLVRAKRLASAG